MENLKLTLCYDGSGYHGWQRQDNAMTVQQQLEEALSRVVKQEVTVTGCSRTDAGVHAKEYVCNTHIETSVPDDKMPYALNALLPDDICVLSCERVADEFHARFDTVAKEYCYTLCNQPHKDPFMRNHAWHYPYPLDFQAMERASRDLTGTYDCTVFEAAGSDTKGSRVRSIYKSELTKEGTKIQFRICANGYLYNMVRIMMGTLVSIGNGKLRENCIPELIEKKDRRLAGITAAPQGLSLTKVWYEKGDWCK